MKNTMTRYALRIAGVALAIAVAAMAAGCDGAKAEPQTISIPDTGFSIEIPGSWLDIPEAEGENYAIAKITPDEKAGILASCEALSAEDGILPEKDYLALVDEAVLEGGAEFDAMLGVSMDTTIGAEAIPAAQRTASAKADGLDTTWLITVAHNDAYYFTVAFFATTDMFDKVRGHFDDYLATVSIEDVGAPTEAAQETPGSEAMQTVESTQGTELKMDIPADWVVNDDPAEGNPLTYAAPGEQLIITVFEDAKTDLQPGLTAEDYAKLLAERMIELAESSEEYTGATAGELVSLTVAGAPAARIDVSLSVSGIIVVNRLTAIAFEEGDYYVQVTFSGLPSYHERYSDIADAILESIRYE
ncbi:MAG: hypothetical protein LBR44_03075 [Clostridiales Family XIII bacterium]|jgi:hypothetical protein|nr:hypothetical protein [Clostridiales Family XIII bacterium]